MIEWRDWLLAQPRRRTEGTPLEELVRLAHQRWAIEQGYQQLKEELGLDHFEGRSCRGLHHHLVLCFLTFCFLVHLQSSKKRPSLPEVRRWLMEALALCTCPRSTRPKAILDTL